MLPTSLIKGLGSLGKGASWLVPPSNDLDLNTEQGITMYRWRLTVAGLLGLLAVCFIWSTGLVPGTDGYARASDVEEGFAAVGNSIGVVETKTDAITLELKEARIIERHEAYCRELEPEKKSYELSRRNALIDEWEDVAKMQYDFARLPNCTDVPRE